VDKKNDGPLLAHVLFMDIVGSAKMPTDQQWRIKARLNELVRANPEFQQAEKADQLISLPTGDGMALAFFDRLDSAVACAVDLSKAIQAESLCRIRMGVHSGPVFIEEDIRGNPNLNGAGINLAERVMSAGGAGHILISDQVAQSLRQLGPWRDKIHEIGECRVKDGWIRVWNLVDGTVGNPQTPAKSKKLVIRKRWMLAAGSGILALCISAAALGVERWVASMKTLPVDQASIAVLPFKDASGDKDQVGLAEGLADELRSQLTTVPGLKVSGDKSSSVVAEKKYSYKEIADQLKVGSILEGTVQRYHDQVRVTVTLIRAIDGVQMWSQPYDRSLSNIFAIQSDIARTVTGALKLALLPQAAAKKTVNPKAYTEVQWGHYYLEHQNEQNLLTALAHFENAAKIDEKYADAWLGIAMVRQFQLSASFVKDVEGAKRQMRQAQNLALALDPNSAEIRANEGWIKLNIDWDFVGADWSFQEARKLAPTNLTAIRGAAQVAGNLGRLKEAVALHDRVLELDPLSPVEYFHAGLLYYDAGDLEKAKASFEKSLQLDPDHNFTHCSLGQALLLLGKPQEALAENEKETADECKVYTKALVYQNMGREKESEDILQQAIAKYGKDMAYEIATVYAVRNDKDRAFEWLNKAYDGEDPGLVLMKIDPTLKNLHTDPRFTAFLKKMKLAN